MENEEKEYKELPINHLVINGKRVEGALIPKSMTNNINKLNVTIFTDIDPDQEQS